MKEKTMKRREWIKNITIIFLIIMLLLTFFSNTIMNYSLPEVATQYVTAGNITAKVRGTGTVMANDPYNVTIGESRVISSVAVKTGTQVEKGDVLFLLEDSESTELKEAQKTLDQLKLAYETALLTGDISSSVYTNVNAGTNTSVATYLSQIEAIKNSIAAAEANVAAYQTSVNNITKQMEILNKTIIDVSAEAAALATADINLENAKAAEAAAKSNKESAQSTVDAYGITITEAQEAVDSTLEAKTVSDNSVTQTAYAAAVTNYNSLSTALTVLSNANTTLKNATNKVASEQIVFNNVKKAKEAADSKNETTVSKLQIQLVEENAKMVIAQGELDKLKVMKDELVKNIQAELSLGSQGEQIAEQSQIVEKLKSKAIGSEVIAPISGTVTNVNKIAGESTSAEEVLAVIQNSEKGYTLEFSVTNEQAKKVSIGDMAELTNFWYYSDLTATVAGIRTDTAKPTTNKLLVFELKGELTGGQSLSLSVGQKSSDYDLIVPNSAIREDNNGKFILIVETKSSPLGNRYIATRVDVEVLASDDTQTAVSGGLYGYEYVITTSTKPVEAGKQVRLAQ